MTFLSPSSCARGRWSWTGGGSWQTCPHGNCWPDRICWQSTAWSSRTGSPWPMISSPARLGEGTAGESGAEPGVGATARPVLLLHRKVGRVVQEDVLLPGVEQCRPICPTQVLGGEHLVG